MNENTNEKIEINGKILQYGVLSDGTGYQVYTYPGMTVAEEIRTLHQIGFEAFFTEWKLKRFANTGNIQPQNP